MNKLFFRRLIVRCIEDLCFAVFLVVCIWLVCTVVGGALTILGMG